MATDVLPELWRQSQLMRGPAHRAVYFTSSHRLGKKKQDDVKKKKRKEDSLARFWLRRTSPLIMLTAAWLSVSVMNESEQVQGSVSLAGIHFPPSAPDAMVQRMAVSFAWKKKRLSLKKGERGVCTTPQSNMRAAAVVMTSLGRALLHRRAENAKKLRGVYIAEAANVSLFTFVKS